MATTESGVTINLTEHDIIVAQAAQKELLAEQLRLLAGIGDQLIDGMSVEDARHALKTAAALARDALARTRMMNRRPNAVNDLTRLAVACGNHPFEDCRLCSTCNGSGYLESPAA